MRKVLRIIPARRTSEGEGFAVRRAFPTEVLDHVDPFLLLDEMGPSDLGPGEAKGAPDHPHRGFETVTYLLSGRMEHHDSAGNHGTLGPGDIQWMTAGAGVVHSEMPETVFAQEGGRMHGFQLWVNLPASDKRMAPRYQDRLVGDIPVVEAAEGRVWVRVIAGRCLGVAANIETRIPILYLHARLRESAELLQPVPSGWNALVYVFRGSADLGPDRDRVGDGHLAILGADGESIRVACSAEAGEVELLLLAGVPLREPVVRYGPFVMNTREEILQAIQDYQQGKMGTIGS